MDGLDKPDSADIATDCLELLKPYKIAPEYFFVDENKPGQQVSLQLNSEEEFGVAEGQEALDLFELEDDEGLNEMIQTTDSGLILSEHIDVSYHYCNCKQYIYNLSFSARLKQNYYGCHCTLKQLG